MNIGREDKGIINGINEDRFEPALKKGTGSLRLPLAVI